MLSAFALGVPAFYAAKEAEKHRRSEKHYRKMELELASIDPYIESLPEEQRDQLKQKLAERLFAQPEPQSDLDETVGADSIFKLLEKVVTQAIKR